VGQPREPGSQQGAGELGSQQGARELGSQQGVREPGSQQGVREPAMSQQWARDSARCQGGSNISQRASNEPGTL